MKKLLFIAVAIITLTAVSCESDEDLTVGPKHSPISEVQPITGDDGNEYKDSTLFMMPDNSEDEDSSLVITAQPQEDEGSPQPAGSELPDMIAD